MALPGNGQRPTDTGQPQQKNGPLPTSQGAVSIFSQTHRTSLATPNDGVKSAQLQPQLGAAISQPHEASQPQLASQPQAGAQQACLAAQRALMRAKMQCFLQGEQHESQHEASQPQLASQPQEGSAAQPQLGSTAQPHEGSQPQLASQHEGAQQCFAAMRAFRREKRQHFFGAQHGSQHDGSQPQLGSTQPQLGSAAQPQPPMPQA